MAAEYSDKPLTHMGAVTLTNVSNMGDCLRLLTFKRLRAINGPDKFQVASGILGST